MATTRDYIKIHFIVFLWGFTAILGKLITIPSVEMVFYRTILAAVGIALVMLFKKGLFKIERVEIFQLILTGFIVSAHWITFFGAARLSNVSVSLVGFATASLWTAILEPVLSRNRIKGYEVFLGCAVIVGIIIIFTFDFSYRLGFIVGIISGFLVSIFSIINSKAVKRINPYTITFYEMAGAAVGTALFLPFYKEFMATGGTLKLIPTGLDWFYIAILALVCTVYAFTVMVEIMKRVSVFFIQLSVNLEPVYGIIMALLIFQEKERMKGNFYAGTLVILGAVLLYPYLKRKFDKPLVSNN
ncbi:MAG TPA: DMT family transporter [Cyclobacteriaceae bacterium]|nr:DMT family transporter [Cyclobacteriaceae bacterium]